MPSVDDEVKAFLAHRAAYDPQKRRDYYLRTRHLKGRPTSSPPTTGRGGVQTTVTSAKQVRTETEARVQALKARLEKLNKVIQRLGEEAKARSGAPPTSSSSSPSSKTSTKSSSSSKEHKTAQQKQEDAKRAKDYRQKHQNDPPSPSQQTEQLKTKIEAAKKTIAQMRQTIEDAKKRARQQSSQTVQSETAPSGR